MKAVGAVGIAVLGLVVSLAMLVTLLGDEEPAPTVDTGGLSDAVPAEFREALILHGARCTQISPALLAAQIEAESGWNPRAESPVGARGLAQFMPGTWASYGTDGDGDGKADVYNPADAIASQAKYMCALAELVTSFGIPGDLTSLILAAYNAGPGAVKSAGGIPPFAETQGYVTKILAAVKKYQAAMAGGGGWRDPVPDDKVVRGTPFHKPGPMWAWKGWHTGVDYPVPLGTPILAAAAGTVSDIRVTPGGYGQHVFIDHGTIDGRQITTLYAHMQAFQPGLTVGQTVEAGTQIGQVGATGNVTGPHLHFEVRADFTDGADDNEFLDPWAWLASHKGDPKDPDDDSGGNGSKGSATARQIVTSAKEWLGTPYVYGGGELTGPSGSLLGGATGTPGFDCSGLTRAAAYVGSDGAITLPRTTDQQAKAGKKVAKAKDRKPGDLIFFDTLKNGTWGHVGIYIGDGKMIHAPRTGKNVEITTVSSGYYAKLKKTTRRIV